MDVTYEEKVMDLRRAAKEFLRILIDPKDARGEAFCLMAGPVAEARAVAILAGKDHELHYVDQEQEEVKALAMLGGDREELESIRKEVIGMIIPQNMWGQILEMAKNGDKPARQGRC